MLEWAAGIDSNKKDVAKVAGEAVVRLLDLSSRLIFQIPHEKDNPVVKGIKYVAIADSVYKCLIKGKDEDDDEKKESESTPDPEDMVAEKQHILMLPPTS